MCSSMLARSVSVVVLSGLAALSACGDEATGAWRAVSGGGVHVAGWSARFDDAAATPADIRFAAADDGYEVATGPNVVLWEPAHVAAGRYRLSVDVVHVDSHDHHHGAGLVFGGADLDGPAQRYTYFLVHGGGQLLIKRRDGDATTDLAPWILHPAVAKDDEHGVARNTLAVDVQADETRFFVNGAEVFRAATGDVHTDGIYGFRLVHDLDVRFSPVKVERGE